MATYNLPGAFNQVLWDYSDPVRPIPAAGGLITTLVSGTNTPATTYQDAAGVATNTNPIVADENGQYRMWLDPAIVYTIKWSLADGTLVRSEDNVVGAQAAGVGVESVNTQTGVVTLAADQIPYATTTSTTWFTGTDVSSALDAVIERADAVPAAAVAVDDAGDYFTGTNVETVLQEIGARSSHGAILRITPFTASGTWTPGTDTVSVVVEVVGGGGGSTAQTNGGGGGGGGGYSRKFVAAPGATEVVTIGLGGSPNTAGGSSSFGSWATANGGGGATGTNAGGIGGTATGGDINLAGAGGQAGGNTAGNAQFGAGGSSYLGGGAPGQWNGAVGTQGSPNTGGGGSGGTGGGAYGGSGLVLITELT